MELIHQHLILLHVLNALLEQSQISIEHHAKIVPLGIFHIQVILNALDVLM